MQGQKGACKVTIVQVPLAPNTRRTYGYVHQRVDSHGKEQGAARAPLMFSLRTRYGETGTKQGGRFLVACFGEVIEQGAVFLYRSQEALPAEAVERIFEIQLQQRMVGGGLSPSSCG
jgi:hypothetical protein